MEEFLGRAIILGNMDFELYLTKDEFYNLKDNELEGDLQDFHNMGIERKFKLTYEDSRGSSDGIRVDYNDKEQFYHIKMSEKAHNNIEYGRNLITRYGNEWGIKISIEECPFPTKEQIAKSEEEYNE